MKSKSSNLLSTIILINKILKMEFELRDQYFFIIFLNKLKLFDCAISSKCKFKKGAKFFFKSIALVTDFIASLIFALDCIFATSYKAIDLFS